MQALPNSVYHYCFYLNVLKAVHYPNLKQMQIITHADPVRQCVTEDFAPVLRGHMTQQVKAESHRGIKALVLSINENVLLLLLNMPIIAHCSLWTYKATHNRGCESQTHCCLLCSPVSAEQNNGPFGVWCSKYCKTVIIRKWKSLFL